MSVNHGDNRGAVCDASSLLLRKEEKQIADRTNVSVAT